MLKFVGPRGADGQPEQWIVGVPTRDLTDEDLVEYRLDADELVASGLYERTHPAMPWPSASTPSTPAPAHAPDETPASAHAPDGGS